MAVGVEEFGCQNGEAGALMVASNAPASPFWQRRRAKDNGQGVMIWKGFPEHLYHHGQTVNALYFHYTDNTKSIYSIDANLSIAEIW